MAEKDVSKKAANFPLWAALPVFSKPNGKYRPIAIGTVSNRLFSCSLIKLVLTETRDYFAPNTIAIDVPVGMAIAIYAFKQTVSKYG